MAIYFLDTSAVVKRYVQEIGTAWVQSLTEPQASHSLFVARITLVETVAAVTRRSRGGGLSTHDAAMVLLDFRHDFTHQYRAVETSAGLVAHAAALAERHALRAYDSVQLASALAVWSLTPSLVLISADLELNTAAAAKGLLVDDPSTHP